MLLDCEECNAVFRGEIFRKQTVPLTLPIRELPKYLRIEGPASRYVSAIKINGKWQKVSQDKTLLEETKGAAIQELKLSYMIDLSIEILTPQGNRPVEFQISSCDTIQVLKQRFEEECKFKDKLQKWIIREKEIEGDSATFEELGFDHTSYRVEVEEILNLEYYGFAHPTRIKAESFR